MNRKPIPQSIDPHLIRMDLGTQARKGTNDDTVREYAEAMEAGAIFPPPTVFFDVVNVLYILADGFHRLLAHLKAKPNDPIIVEQYLGTVEDAQWYSIGANISHGLKRSNEDKRNAVMLALLHANGTKLSNRQIAEYVSVTHSMLNKVRKEMEDSGRLETVSSRIGKDGRTYNTANIGKRPEMCGGCAYYESPRCTLDGEMYLPSKPKCTNYRPIPDPEPEEKKDSRSDIPDDSDGGEAVFKEKRHRASRLKKGEYVDVPLNRTNTDLAAVEIRHYLGENYLAALIQSAQNLLRD